MKTIQTLTTVSPATFFGGKIIYGEYRNPYETIKVYLLVRRGLLIGDFVSDHSYDGTTSWRLVNLDSENYKKLKGIVKRDFPYRNVENFLRNEFYQQGKKDTFGFVNFLEKNQISYESKYYG